MDLNMLLIAAGIFALRVVGNMFTTVRLVVIVRGQKLVGAILAVFESLIFAVALGSVVQNLDNVLNLAAYSVGYAVGGYLGVMLEQRLVMRFVAIQIISPKLAHSIAVAVREAGYGATESWGMGGDGQVGWVQVAVVHKQVNNVVKVVQSVDPGAFVMMEELRGISHGYFRRRLRS